MSSLFCFFLTIAQDMFSDVLVNAKATTAFFKRLAAIGHPNDLILQEQWRREATQQEKLLAAQVAKQQEEIKRLQEANARLTEVRFGATYISPY